MLPWFTKRNDTHLSIYIQQCHASLRCQFVSLSEFPTDSRKRIQHSRGTSVGSRGLELINSPIFRYRQTSKCSLQTSVVDLPCCDRIWSHQQSLPVTNNTRNSRPITDLLSSIFGKNYWNMTTSILSVVIQKFRRDCHWVTIGYFAICSVIFV